MQNTMYFGREPKKKILKRKTFAPKGLRAAIMLYLKTVL
jgi:hypothetical protein